MYSKHVFFQNCTLCTCKRNVTFPLPFAIILPKTSIENILNLWQGLGYLVLIGDQNLVTPRLLYSLPYSYMPSEWLYF